MPQSVQARIQPTPEIVSSRSPNGNARSERTLSFVDAVREAADQEMARDPSVIVFGLDVDDPKAIQGTTRGLLEKYGAERVFGLITKDQFCPYSFFNSRFSGRSRLRALCDAGKTSQ